jgi:hypothetical protein
VSARFAKAHETIDSIDFIGEIASFWRAVFPVSNPSSGTTPKPGVNEHRAVLVASILLLLHWQTVDADAPAVCTAIPNSRRRQLPSARSARLRVQTVKNRCNLLLHLKQKVVMFGLAF